MRRLVGCLEGKDDDGSIKKKLKKKEDSKDPIMWRHMVMHDWCLTATIVDPFEDAVEKNDRSPRSPRSPNWFSNSPTLCLF